MRAGPLIRVVLIALVLAAIATAVAIFIPWLPDQASKEGERIDFVFWFVTAICIGIFSVVASISVYSLVKFRVRPDDDSDGPPVHGHTGIEIAWTAIPLVLVLAMIVVSSVALAQNDKEPDDALRVEVLGQQFAWVFAYPPAGAREDEYGFACFERRKRLDPASGEEIVDISMSPRCRTSSNLRLPVDRSARLHMTAREVIHSFFVPEFRQKQDVIPGSKTEITVTPTRRGDFPLFCTELCGLGHALMRTRAIVMEPGAFDQWVAAGRPAPGRGQSGKALFTEHGCNACHRLADANATGTQGPNLDELPRLARGSGRPLEEFVRQSIVDPGAYVERGFGDIMPRTFGELPDEQIDSLVQYLVRVTGGSR